MTGPQFPIYIPSKGRHESRLTARAFDVMGVPYRMIVEEQEYAAYAAVIDPARLLILDPQYQRDYDPGDDLGDSKPKGSGAARNFGWDHSISEGHERHWMVDDNIKAFYRLNRNLKVPVSDGAIFRAMEDFTCRYTNVAMAGPNYFMFASRKSAMPPFVPNTRIYSCNLIKNDVPFRWRCRYNEDTDLSLRMLKAGYCTVLFNAFLQEKSQTLTMKGGNTDTVYKDGTLPKSRMIAALHPDVARVAWRFKRWHHYVDYSPFKSNKLIRHPDLVIPDQVDDYGMKLVSIEPK
jgi:hypothetical protein